MFRRVIANLKFETTSKRDSFADDIVTKLDEVTCYDRNTRHGEDTRGNPRSGVDVRPENAPDADDLYAYSIRTLSYREFGGLKEKWYRNGRKIVPKDFNLSQISLKWWFLGDGHLRTDCGGTTISTDGFRESDVDYLVEELNGLELNSKKHKHEGGFTIYISADSGKILENIVDEGFPFEPCEIQEEYSV